ncbi:MAG TPA: lipopolysaccharide kinase InaA family protein [Planctomycetota bacterium]|nr:lipopolysaccharide kinase InaA family protein [Planctomycetota bacterium]
MRAEGLERGRLGRYRFAASAEGARILRAMGGGLLEDPARIAGASLVKENDPRSVWRLAREGAYLKVHRPAGARAWIPRFVRSSPARREWTVAWALREAGLPAAEPLALLESGGLLPGRAVYLCREIRDSRTADEHLASLEGGRAAALHALATLLARIHAAGFDPRDLHGGDLLVGEDGQVSLVDLHAVAGPRPLPRARRARGIALLRRGLRGSLREGEGESLLASYLDEARLAGDASWGEEVRRAEGGLERAWRRSRLRRCLEDRREFATARSSARRLFRRRDVPPGEVERALAAHAAPARILDRTPRGVSTVVEGTGGAPWLVKETRAGGPLRALADALRGSRGRRAWKGAHLLGLLGLPTPRALALVEERRGPLVVRSFLVREYVAESSTLRAFLEGPYGSLGPGDRRRLVRAVARAAGSLHRARLVHRDLATKNLLVRRRGAEFEVLPIDLEDLRSREVTERVRVAALAQLDDSPRVVSRADRLRFLRAYEEIAGVSLSRRAIGEVLARSRARAARRAGAR